MGALHIWIVEDDNAYQEILKTYLAMLGHSVTAYTSGEACLQHLHDHPDVVLLDHNLGNGLNGVEVLQKIKLECPTARVIFISGEENVSLVSETYRYGSLEFITKDSASLLRLKLMLEKVSNDKNKIVQTVKKRRTLLVAGVALLVMAVTLYLMWG